MPIVDARYPDSAAVQSTQQSWTLTDTINEDVRRAFRAREKALENAVRLLQDKSSGLVDQLVLQVAAKFEDYLLNGNHPA
jgi:hypothetical protein